MSRHNFKKLKIWQDSIKLISLNYKLTKRYNLISQMNRGSVSIASNISEGAIKRTDRHFKTFLENSLGSAFEWETQLIVARNEGYLNQEEFEDSEDKILQLQKMIGAFIDKLNN